MWDGLENPSSWKIENVAGAALGAVPEVIPLSQRGSSGSPGCLPLSPLLPDTQHSSSRSQVLLAGGI